MSENLLENMNLTFYNDCYTKVFEDVGITPFLCFTYNSLRIIHRQTTSCGITEFWIDDEEVAYIEFQATSLMGVFMNKLKALSNKDFNNLVYDLLNNSEQYSAFGLTIDDFEDISE